jgi:hypothetical protein
MLRVTSTDPVEITTPNGAWIIDPVTRTVDEGDGPRPFTDAENALIPTVQQIEEWRIADEAPFIAEAAAETLRVSMFTLTDQIIAWCQDSSAYLFGPRDSNGVPLYGSFDPAEFVTLLQTAETRLLAYKALSVVTDAVRDQRDWMLQRGQQAQSILAYAAVVK